MIWLNATVYYRFQTLTSVRVAWIIAFPIKPARTDEADTNAFAKTGSDLTLSPKDAKVLGQAIDLFLYQFINLSKHSTVHPFIYPSIVIYILSSLHSYHHIPGS